MKYQMFFEVDAKELLSLINNNFFPYIKCDFNFSIKEIMLN